MSSDFRESLPACLRETGRSVQGIYQVCLALVLAAGISLPLVRVPVTVTGRGFIRPEGNRAEIIPAVSGIIEEVLVEEGQDVGKSTPLIRIRSREIEASRAKDREELDEILVYLQDIRGLLDEPVLVPKSERYLADYHAYSRRIEYLEMLFRKADHECSRHSGLYEKALISEQEYDNLCFERDKAREQILGYRAESVRNWRTAYNEFLVRKRILENHIWHWHEEILNTTLLSPVSGSIVELKGLYPGTSVSAGEVVGIISPHSELIGEFYIEPKDIAFVHPKQVVRLSMHSFPPREWGMPTGAIYEISDDFLVINQRPVYRVKCRLEQTVLQLSNGYRANVKKGMTFHAHCIVANRTLLQLLWDKSDRWLNPLSHAPR